MKKKLISKLLITTLMSTMLFTAIPSFATNTIAIKIVLNGQEINYNQESGYPYIDQNNRTLVPFRQTMEAFGCEVQWNQKDQIATASKNGTTVQVPIGQSYILKGTEKVANDTQAVVKNGKTYLPIAVVLKSFGADVEWDNSNKAVVAKSEDKPQEQDLTNNTTNTKNTTQNTSTYTNNDKENPPVVIPPADTTPDINNLNINKDDYEEFLSHFEIKQWDSMYNEKTTKVVIYLSFKDSSDKNELTSFLKSIDYYTLQSYTLQIIKDKCMNYDKISVVYMTKFEDLTTIAFNAVEITNNNGMLQYIPISWGKSWE